MGVRTSLLAITLTSTEIADLAAAPGEDAVGQLNGAVVAVADAIEVLNAIYNYIPGGANKTAIGTQITALT